MANLMTFDFPREVGLFRKVVNSRRELETYWSKLENTQCAYMSVYGFRGTKPNGRRAEYNTAVIRNFVLDFDRKRRENGTVVDVSGDEVLEQVRRLHNMLMSKDVNHAVWFSGNGFHIWIRLSIVHRPANGGEVSIIKSAGRKVINEWKDALDLSCMDPTVPFDMARMIRIPNSYNAKQHVGRWSIPLSTRLLQGTWDEICERAEDHQSRPMYEYGNNGVDLPIEQVRKSRFLPQAGPSIHFDTVKMGDIKILPCLMQAACQVGSNPPHDARFSLVTYLSMRLRNFLPVERTTAQMRQKHADTICDYIASLQWADYDESITNYQVRSIVERGYTQHCATLYDKGFCLGRCQLWDGTGDLNS